MKHNNQIVCPKCHMNFNTEEALIYHLKRPVACDEYICKTCSTVCDSNTEYILHEFQCCPTQKEHKLYGTYVTSSIYEHMTMYTNQRIIGMMQCKVPHSNHIINSQDTSKIIYMTPQLLMKTKDVTSMIIGKSVTSSFANDKRDREQVMEILLDRSYFSDNPPSFLECLEVEIKFNNGVEMIKLVISYDSHADIITNIYVPISNTSVSKFLETDNSPGLCRRLCSWM